MEFVIIELNHLYAVKYQDEVFDEYNRIFEDFTNHEKVSSFFEINKWKIGQYYVEELGWSRNETEAYTQKVVEEANELEDILEDLIDNSVESIPPGLSSRFSILEGFEKEALPAMKSYGIGHPSLLRIYAIELDSDQLIVFYSGIKITHKISDCPILKDNVIQKAHRVIDFLKNNDILTVGDLNSFISHNE